MSARVAGTGTSPPVELKLVPASESPPGLAPLASPAPTATPGPTRRRWRWRRWAIGAAILLAAAVVEEAWRAARTPTPAHYVTAAVTRGAITRTVTASGSVNPVTTVQVGTYVSGVIQKLSCDFNTVVRRGQLCAKIDPRPYQTVVDQDRAALSTARAQLAKDTTTLEYARLTLARTTDLRQRGIVSQDAADAARSAFDQAASQVALDEATIEQRAAALRSAEINLGYTDIVSPVSGTVVSRNVTMGQTVAASFQTPTLFLIATDLTQMQVDANVSESDIGGVARGRRATFTVEAFPARTFDGTVNQVRQAPQTVQNVVTYDVVIGVSNEELLLKPGMTATVRIVVDERRDALRVPDAALRYAPGGVHATPAGAAGGGGAAAARVWVLRNGRPVAVPVVLGLRTESYAEIVGGEVTTADQVITSEQPQARPAARIPAFRM